MARLFGRQALTTGSPYNELDNDQGRKSHIGEASKMDVPTIVSLALEHFVVQRRNASIEGAKPGDFELGRRGSATEEEFGLNNDGLILVGSSSKERTRSTKVTGQERKINDKN